MRSMRKTLSRSAILGSIILVFIVGLLPLISLWNQNRTQIQAIAVVQPLWMTVLFIIITGSLWLLFSRSPEKAALLACVTFLFFFSFGHLYNLLQGKTFLGFSIGFAKLFLVCLIVFSALIVLVFRMKKVPKNTILILNVVSAALLLENLIPVFVHQIKLIKTNSPSTPTANLTQKPGTKQRDIYYILLDAYSRTDMLKKVLNYDNSAFITALKDRGFYVPECAFSNYDGTELTVDSVLNFDILQDLDVSGKKVGQDIAENPNRIIENNARSYFKQYGYQFVSGRGYLPSNDITNADIYLNYSIDTKGRDDLSQKRFLALYMNTTVMRVVTELYNENPGKFVNLPYWWTFNLETNSALVEATSWYYQNKYMFDSVEKIPSMPGDYLVYAHINAPHGPYVFQSDGSFQYPMGNPLDPQLEKKLYTNEVIYLDQRVLTLVDTLLKTSDPQPIIIIQGDHGMHNFTTGLDKHKILSAYYLPGNLISPPYPTITPVNDFRLIIKNYFDPSFELSPDILYVKSTNDYESVHASCDLQP